jgi:hypothetical protein
VRAAPWRAHRSGGQLRKRAVVGAAPYPSCTQVRTRIPPLRAWAGLDGAIRSLRLFVFGLAFCGALTANAQDAPMTVRGQTATPVRSPDIALHGLSVELEFLPDREAFRVKAQFELENRATREARLQLGLAEARCESDSDEDDPCGDPIAFRFEELESSLRDAPLPARRGRLDSKHEWAPALGGVWLFDARLKPRERAPVQHRYVVPGGPAAGGGMSASFVTRTGGLWSEPIDKATFTFVLPVYSCLVVEPEHIARRNRRVVLRGGKPWLQLTYAAQRWTPKGDVTLHFETCVPPRDTELSGCALLDALAGFAYGPSPEGESTPVGRDELKAQLTKLSETELRSCGQAVFEAYASYYKPEELAVLAKRPAAQRHYTGPLLTPDDWKWVGLVDEVLAQRKPTPPAAATRKAADGGCSVAEPFANGAASWACLLLLAAAWRTRRARTK